MFAWRGVVVHSYPAMQYIGLCAGVLVGNAAARQTGIDPFRTFIATCILLVPALAGARILHVATHWSYYRRHRARIWDTSEGGAAQYGGIILAVPISVPLLRFFDIPFAEFWDVSMVTIMVGMIFTRIGCFLNGCCAGRPTDSWIGMHLPDHRGNWENRMPTQLLEAAWATALLLTGLQLWPRFHFAGALFLFVSGGYAAGRLLLESTRVKKREGTGFTIHHGISLLIIALCVTALTMR
jgi:phosphatidylglycerol:prolipoprotein diacylglycerol transferase